MRLEKGSKPNDIDMNMLRGKSYYLTNTDGFKSIETDDPQLIADLKTKGFIEK